MGQGQAIICVEVASGSEADEAGVRRGMRLTAISDPIRRNEVWRLQDRPSLKNIRELFKMRSADTIDLEFTEWNGPVPGAAQGGAMSMASAASSTDGSAAPSAVSSLDGDAGALPGESIGDRLQRQYAAAAVAGRSQTAVEKRQQRRREAMAISDARDDRPLLLGLFAMFALPPLVILGVAQATGYLDALYTNTLTGMH
ncbi:hypothetical protein Rsub_12742 [Raphidocelis subcapitata]|uniref:PDZ domain-containing protein n=1 Tax=Raphidocelis subcapitata TaxID=307507 RepID=A0A2V0PPZ4_9CHLO|nr:hypothetical protein Rsub_12742 [Raphidocelis subcapitata]|eukprot:GBG00131.1 hypothetical protein Rsub_12742 [Raphidocelis subcapitata]